MNPTDRLSDSVRNAMAGT